MPTLYEEPPPLKSNAHPHTQCPTPMRCFPPLPPYMRCPYPLKVMAIPLRWVTTPQKQSPLQYTVSPPPDVVFPPFESDAHPCMMSHHPSKAMPAPIYGASTPMRWFPPLPPHMRCPYPLKAMVTPFRWAIIPQKQFPPPIRGHVQKIPLNSSMLNGSFLLLVQNFHGPKLPSHSKNWLDNGSIIDIPLNGSVLRRARLKLITGTLCRRFVCVCFWTMALAGSIPKHTKRLPPNRW